MEKGEPYIPAYEKGASLKAYKCSSCNRIYSAQVFGNQITGRIPLLLPCSHTLCDYCVKSARKSEPLTCRICDYEITFQESQSIQSILPVDRYLYGSILNTNAEPKISFLHCTPAGASLQNTYKKNPNKILHDANDNKKTKCCRKECGNYAKLSCIECRQVFCKKCDKIVHDVLNYSTEHQRFNLDAMDICKFNVLCEIHWANNAEYSCITCEKMLCSKCVIKDHGGHEIISIEDKNLHELDEFNETLQKAKYILRSMESTNKKIRLETSQKSRKFKSCDAEYEIYKHFSQLHSRLQVMESRILEQYRKTRFGNDNSFQKIRTELDSNIEVLSPLVSTAMHVISDKKNMDKLLLSDLHQKIKDLLDLPCQLLEEANNDIDGTQIKFSVDDSITETLENHCRLECNEAVSFKLIPLTDFTDVNLDADDTSSILSDSSSIVASTPVASNSRSNSVSKSSKTNCKSKVSLTGVIPTVYINKVYKKPEKSPSEPIVFTKDTEETVKVTHLVNPALFYVQLTRKNREFQQLTEKYGNYADTASVPANIIVGNTYIVEYAAEKSTSWCRALVKEELYTGITQMYDVFFIDYGNSSLVPLVKIREMKSIFMREPPFAYKCQLHGIISRRDDWNDEVLTYMLKFITASKDASSDPEQIESLLANSNNYLNMTVMSYEKSTLSVNLSSTKESLNESLIFVGFASREDPQQEEFKVKKIETYDKKMIPTTGNFNEGEIQQIVVSHVINPAHFYIQLRHNRKFLHNLESLLATEFKRNDKKSFIFKPEMGLVCAAYVNKKWYRVQIMASLGGGIVLIFAVDYGFSEQVSWEQLRILSEKHQMIDAMAVKVSLHNLKPLVGDDWDDKAREFLRQYCHNEFMSMQVIKISKEQLDITLYEQSQEKDICINALLVRKDLAAFTDTSILLVEYQSLSQLDNFVDDKRITGTIPIPAHERFNTKGSKVTPPDVKPSAPRPKICSIGGQLTMPVEILLVESPSSFYVTCPAWASEKMKLFNDMADFYEIQQPALKTWKLHDKCVVKSKDNLFYRALVLNVLEKGNYQVFLNDVARKETASAADMFELDSNFMVRDYSVRCKLGGLKPTGGLDYWSHAAIDYFKEVLEEYHQFYMQKLEPVQDKVMSIKLISVKDKAIGPLDPESQTRFSINHLVLEKGLALPVKLISTGETITSRLEETDDVFNVEDDLVEKIDSADDGAFALPISYRQQTPQITSWLPPTRFKDAQFLGWPSYVDHDGFIYIQTEQSRHILKNVSRILEACFKKGQVLSIDKYEVGSLCTVKYHLDDSFTRGVVTKTTGEKLFVRLVDFGNEEEVNEDEIRAEIGLTDVPILTTKCKLSNVIPKTPNGKWPITVLDTLHLTIVDNQCQIFLDEEDHTISEIPRINLYLKNICINKVIMDWDFAKNSAPSEAKSKNVSLNEDEDVVIETDEVDDPINNISIEETVTPTSPSHIMQYQHISLPENESTFEAIVINLIDYKTVVVEATFLRDILQETAKQFEEMIVDINNIANTLPPLEDPMVGLPCVGLFGSDNCWYRAEILSIDTGNQIKILFVDYGNVEIVPLKEIRVILPKWLEFPVQMLTCKLWGVYKDLGEDDLDVALEMRSVLVDKKVLCDIKTYPPDLEVELFDCKDLTLMYDKLIQKGVILLLE